MEYLNVFKADWNYQEISKLELEGIRIDQDGIFQLTDERKIKWVLKNCYNAKKFYHNKARVIFSNIELLPAKTLMLQEIGPALVYPSRLGKDDEGFGYLKYAFSEICFSCNSIPKAEQVRPITLSKEPKLAKKYIWGGFHGVSGYVFTDLERYKILNKKWGLGKREVLIGAKQKVSQDFVQLDIPISTSPLCFGDSDFGNTFKLDDSGEIDNTVNICPECKRPLYTNQILDFFPSFKEDIDFDIVFTQEWFGWYRRLVISRKFAEWLSENKYLEWNSNYIIPVKNFCN